MEQANFFEHVGSNTADLPNLLGRETQLETSSMIDYVVDELMHFFAREHDRHALEAALMSAEVRNDVEKRAQWMFANDGVFRTECRSKRGSSYLTGFIRTWLSGKVREWFPELHRKLPASFRVTGLPLKGRNQ
ncbi:hypothetical protein [Burkholderia sp. Ac-20365]|uniref:hypothetical protein n=1 Tax=Burkholderia sp. Ac-20365 TaxID=2703897 RepID=UPI00197B62D2|nr:hypothetical protein [Burkholderia sp. Ac-20365]MBN3761351.1 hypothetical protein [Burkholderia sp. Ac-20365]